MSEEAAVAAAGGVGGRGGTGARSTASVLRPSLSIVFSFESESVWGSAFTGCDVESGEKKEVIEPLRSVEREVAESPLVANLRASSTIFGLV